VSTENEQRTEEREVRSDEAYSPATAPPGPAAGSGTAIAALQRRMQAHDRAEERNDPGDAGPPAHGSRTRLLPIYAAIVVATVLFTILMGALVGAL
jgi:hypothetical protein